MKLGALFSGGKDSCLAIHKAWGIHEITCLISLIPKCEESYMFHFPNVWITRYQAEAIGLPIIQMETSGKRDGEIKDLIEAIKLAMKKFRIEGILTGAIRSTYQASRIQRICDKLDLWCFNPLWLKDQVELLNEIVNEGFEVIISGVYAYPLDESFLGKIINKQIIERLVGLWEKYDLNVAGEGGEIETTVLDAPLFKKRIEIVDYEAHYRDNSGIFKIKGLRLMDK